MHPVLKALHLISMVAWFAGLFYMFRLFVYHCIHRGNTHTSGVLKTMAYRLYYYITWPAMAATLVLGIGTAVTAPGVMQMGWFHAKLALLVLLFGYHFFIGYTLKRFAADDLFLSEKQCRLLNEVPTLLLIGIVFLAVLKPF